MTIFVLQLTFFCYLLHQLVSEGHDTGGPHTMLIICMLHDGLLHCILHDGLQWGLQLTL